MSTQIKRLSPAAWRRAATALVACLATAPAHADEQRFALCHAGLITLAPFAQHIEKLRTLDRYSREQIDELIARNRKGGPEFFSSQIVLKEEPSGSGTYDLRMVHGLADAASYRNVTAWTCNAPEDYPIVYFVGFRVRRIEDNTIYVSREKDVVNVISLHELDDKLDRPLAVKLEESKKRLCDDVNKRCNADIFYDNDY